MSANLGVVSCVPCPEAPGTTLVSYLGKCREMGVIRRVNLNSTSDQPLVLNDVTRWIVHRVFICNATGAIATATGGIYTGANKSGHQIVPSSQVFTLADGNAYLDLDLSTYADTAVISSGTVYLSLTTPEGTNLYCDVYVVYDDLDPASVAFSEDGCARVYNIPGPKGDAGTGTDGSDGVDAFTTTAATYAQPASGADVTISMTNAAWMGVAQIIFISGGGYYEVRQITGNSVMCKNLGYAENCAAATNVGAGTRVSPAGPRGSTQTTLVTSLDTIAPAGTVGGMMIHNGTSYIALPAVLNNYRVLRIDTAQTVKVAWDLINLGTWTFSGQLPLLSGGTGASIASTARSNLGAAASGSNSDITALTALTSIKVDTTNGATVTGFLSNTATLDFPSTLNNATSDLTVTVTGAVVGDSVLIGLPAAPAAGVFFGFVSAADTVTIRYRNDTGGTVNPASATYRATVIRI